MTNSDILAMLKSNLQLMETAWDEYLTQLIEVSKREIEREGVELYMSEIDDVKLVVMYASYLYRKRNTDGPMPRMLRYALNNRLFAGKVETEE
jgi:hypothetical protein